MHKNIHTYTFIYISKANTRTWEAWKRKSAIVADPKKAEVLIH